MLGTYRTSTLSVASGLNSIAGNVNCQNNAGGVCYSNVYNETSHRYVYGDTGQQDFTTLGPGKGYWVYVLTNGTSYAG